MTTQAEIAAIANDTSDWNSRKDYCDSHLDQFFESGYVGFDWSDAVVAYSTCYLVGEHLQLPDSVIQPYAKKVLALMRVLSRDQAYGTPGTGQEFLAVGDGSKKSFTLRMPLASGTQMSVYLAPLTQKTFTYSGATTTLCADYCFDAIVQIGSFTRGVDYHEGYPNLLHWLGSNHPSMSASFTASVADQAFTTVASTAYSVSGTTLTLNTAPTAAQAVFVQYMGPDYAQTGNAMGGVESIKPDSHFPMRCMNVGLAWGFDSLRDSALFTSDLRDEYAKLLAVEVDEYMDTTGMNPYLDDPLSNYFLEGELTGTLTSTFAAADQVTKTPEGRVLKDLTKSLLDMARTALDEHIPGGYGFEGTYTNGSDSDVLKAFGIWTYNTGDDLLVGSQWLANVVPATIHGIKPDLMTFYDGGDWNDLPATPLAQVLQSFAHYQPNHAMAPFARQALADLGQPVSGATSDYKNGSTAFPRSFVTAGTGVVYARSDWTTGASWVSMSVGPVFSLGHEHLDRGHITLQRGADYLLKDSGEYGAYDTVPWHNVFAFGTGAAPSECGGTDGGHITPPKVLDTGDFVYAQEDLTKSFCTGVDRAARTLVYVRPDTVLVHDRMQTTSAATSKQWNLNFGAAITTSADIFSTVVGSSKLFMRGLVPANPTPTITPSGTSITGANGSFALKGYNYRLTVSGTAASTFLNVFQLAASNAAQMRASAYVKSTDARAEGAAVDLGSTRWVVLQSISGAALTGSLAWTLPLACPCAHVVGDLAPGVSYQIAVTDSGGGSVQTLTMPADPHGVLSFTTSATSAKNVTITGGP